MQTIFRWTFLPALSLLLLAGCTTSRDSVTVQYQESEDRTVYRARSISLGTLFPTGGLSRDPVVEMRSWATCSGQDCQPQQAWFAFNLRRTESRIVSRRDVRLETDEEVYRWSQENERFGEWNAQSPKSGEIVRISMDISMLRDIAESERLSGRLSGERFSLSYEDRAPLRALLDRMDGQDPL